MTERGKIRRMAANIVAIIRRGKKLEAELVEVRAANGRLYYDLITQRNLAANMAAYDRKASDGSDTIMSMLVQLGNLGAVISFDTSGEWRVCKAGDKNSQHWMCTAADGRQNGPVHVHVLAMRIHGNYPRIERIRPLKDGASLAWSSGGGWR